VLQRVAVCGIVLQCRIFVLQFVPVRGIILQVATRVDNDANDVEKEESLCCSVLQCVV